MILVEKDVEVHYDWDETKNLQKEQKRKNKKEEHKVKKKKNKKEVKKEVKKNNNNKPKTPFILISVILLIVIVIIAFNVLRKKDVTEEVTDSNIAATVNGKIITLEDLNAQYDKLGPQEKSLVSKEFMLEVLIDNELLLQKAAEKNIVVSDAELNAEVARLKSQFPSEETFNQFLESQQLTLEKLGEVTVDSLRIKKVLNQEAFTQIEVTDSEIEKYYQENIEQFTAKEGEIRAAHILVNSTEEAEQILEMLKDGEDFSELAKQHSIGPSGPNGGDLGFFGKEAMVKEFEDAAFALQEGEVSNVVQTQYGYHIIKRKTDIIPLEEVNLQIKQSLLFSKQRAVFQTYMDQLKAQSDVKVYYGTEEVPEEVQDEVTEDIEIPTEEETFKLTTDEICEEDGKPIIRMFSTTTCPHCNWIKETFDSVVDEYGDQIVAYHWQLDIGDNTLTEEVETMIPKEELDVFKNYNPRSTVPTFVFGCKYYRVGNAYSDLELEKEEIKKIINKLVS